MFTRLSGAILAVLFAFSLGNLNSAEVRSSTKDAKGRGKSDAAVIDVNPMGEPSGKLTGLRIWCDKEGWHVRYRAQKHKCKGIIRLVGGKVTMIYDFNGMEVKEKPKHRDIGQLSPDKKSIAFKFYSAGREDGFTFKITASVKKLVFDVQEDGYYHLKRIHIGAKGIPPSQGVFELPAQPKAPDEPAKR
jgi:hypothetical protein